MILRLARHNIERILSQKTTWILLTVVCLLFVLQGLKTQNDLRLSGRSITLGVEAFLPLLSNEQMKEYQDIYWAIDSRINLDSADPYIRMSNSMKDFSFVALMIPLVVGGFYAQKIGGKFERLQLTRGISRNNILLSDFISIFIVTTILTLIAVMGTLSLFFVSQPRLFQPLIRAFITVDAVNFMPQLATSIPLQLYTFLVFTCAAFVSYFLGVFAYSLARLTCSVVISAFAPMAIIWLMTFAFPNTVWPLDAFSMYALDFFAAPVTSLLMGLRYPTSYALCTLTMIAVLVISANCFRFKRSKSEIPYH